MSIYFEEMLSQIESLDAFCERLQRRMSMDPVPSGLEVDADEVNGPYKGSRARSATRFELGRLGAESTVHQILSGRAESRRVARTTSRSSEGITFRQRRRL